MHERAETAIECAEVPVYPLLIWSNSLRIQRPRSVQISPRACSQWSVNKVITSILWPAGFEYARRNGERLPDCPSTTLILTNQEARRGESRVPTPSCYREFDKSFA